MKDNIKEEISLIPNKYLSEKGMLSPEIRKYILENNKKVVIIDGKEKPFSIHALRIIIVLAFNLKERQMKFRSKDRSQQLKLFDDEWLDVENNEAMSVQVNFKYADFLPKGSKNTEYVRIGLEELQERNYLLEFEKIDGSGRARKLRLKSSLISQYLLEEGKGFKLVINNFWYRALINVSEYYTPVLKNTIFSLTHNAMIFYIYINGLPQIKNEKDKERNKKLEEFGKEMQLGDRIYLCRGTIIKKKNLVKMFNTNYIYDSKIEEKILRPIRQELNKTNMSFNYKFDNDNIIIVVYEILSTQVSMGLVTTSESDIIEAVGYRYKKKNLTPTQAVLLCELYLKYTYNVVNKATSRKSNLRNLEGDDFISVFKFLIEKYVKDNRINIEEIAYPDKQELRKRITKRYFELLKDEKLKT